MDGKHIVEGVIEVIANRKTGENKNLLKTIIDDLKHSTDGFMTEEQIGAMIVDLLIVLTQKGVIK